MRFLWPGGGLADPAFGYLTAPNHLGVIAGIQAGHAWGADLGCIDGPEYVKRYHHDKTAAWLAQMLPYRETCLFLAGFDVVGNARRTRMEFDRLYDNFPGWPLAYVAQDGQELIDFPPDETWEVLFIGGSTRWKMSTGAEDCILRAQRLGKRIHIGRVNWWTRYNHFASMEGSNEFTCDGTRPRFGRDKAIVDWKRYMEAPYQPRLFVPGSGDRRESDNG